MGNRIVKKAVAPIAIFLLLGVLPVSASAQEEGVPSDFASDPALYVHAVSGSDDTEAWQKWQGVHDEEFEEDTPEEKYFFLPSSAEKNSVDVYNGYDEEIAFNGVIIDSHTAASVPYEPDTAYPVSVGNENYTLTLLNSNAEAAIYINNPDADGKGHDLMSYLGEDKSRKASASGAIVTPDGSIDHTGIKKIKGRGNTSWDKPKKSFNITYEKEVVIAGMDRNKTYAILANYQDDSLSRNRILYDLSDAVGLPYAPDSRYVDFYVNGFYWGSYLLCEKAEPGSLLPSVEESDYLNDDNTVKEDFDFVVEVDPSAADDDYCFDFYDTTITIVSPKIDPGEPGYDEVMDYVEEKFSSFYDAITSSEDLSEAADIDSVAKLYMINELGKNWDTGAASTFFTYTQDENGDYKFYGSPVWDYDNSLGNATGVKDDLRSFGVTDYEEYTGWWCQYKGELPDDDIPSDNIIARISQNPEIQAAVPAVWAEDFLPALEHFAGDQYDEEIDLELKTRDEYYDLIRDSARMNYESGWLLCTGTWIADHSALYKASFDSSEQKMIVDDNVTNYEQNFADMYDYAADWMMSRAAWLSGQYAETESGTELGAEQVTEPAADIEKEAEAEIEAELGTEPEAGSGAIPEEKEPEKKVQAILTRGVLRVGTAGDYQPMSYLDPASGKYVGFDADLAADLAAEMGVGLEYVKTSWPTLMEDTQEGKFDLAICGITITEARQEQALMSDGYLGNGKTVLCRAEDADKFTSLKAINRPEVRVMENPGGLNEKFALENLPDAELIIHDVNQEIPGLIASGEADVMITEIMEAGYYVGQDSRLAAPLIYEPFTQGELGVLMPKGSEDLLAYVNTFLEHEKSSGRIDELAEKYIYRYIEEGEEQLNDAA